MKISALWPFKLFRDPHKWIVEQTHEDTATSLGRQNANYCGFGAGDYNIHYIRKGWQYNIWASKDDNEDLCRNHTVDDCCRVLREMGYEDLIPNVRHQVLDPEFIAVEDE